MQALVLEGLIQLVAIKFFIENLDAGVYLICASITSRVAPRLYFSIKSDMEEKGERCQQKEININIQRINEYVNQ